MSDFRTASIVLDTSAIAAWTRGSLSVGEILSEVEDENGGVIVPLSCLVEAAHVTVTLEQEMLELLVGRATTYVLPDDAGDWRTLASLRNLIGRSDLASASLLALDAGVNVLTREPSWYLPVGDGEVALPFDE